MNVIWLKRILSVLLWQWAAHVISKCAWFQCIFNTWHLTGLPLWFWWCQVKFKNMQYGLDKTKGCLNCVWKHGIQNIFTWSSDDQLKLNVYSVQLNLCLNWLKTLFNHNNIQNSPTSKFHLVLPKLREHAEASCVFYTLLKKLKKTEKEEKNRNIPTMSIKH